MKLDYNPFSDFKPGFDKHFDKNPNFRKSGLQTITTRKELQMFLFSGGVDSTLDCFKQQEQLNSISEQLNQELSIIQECSITTSQLIYSHKDASGNIS